MSNVHRDPQLEPTVAELFASVGILESTESIPDHLELFIVQAERVWKKILADLKTGELTSDQGIEFQQLLVEACGSVLCHPVVADNRYLRRFSEGVTESQARHECQQFSVFALQFDVAQAKLVANSPTEESYQERLRVLLNEKGIPYQDGFEGELTGRWSDSTVHFTWMLKMAKGLNLKFDEIGKIWIALPGTKKFVEATFDLYGNTDPSTGAGAAFAIENWAANSLWRPWISGMKKLNESNLQKVNLGYLLYHEKEEEHHSQATLDELYEDFQEPWFDAQKFLAGAENMLTGGVLAYYESQLSNLPDRDETWPEEATGNRRDSLEDLRRVDSGTDSEIHSMS